MLGFLAWLARVSFVVAPFAIRREDVQCTSLDGEFSRHIFSLIQWIFDFQNLDFLFNQSNMKYAAKVLDYFLPKNYDCFGLSIRSNRRNNFSHVYFLLKYWFS